MNFCRLRFCESTVGFCENRTRNGGIRNLRSCGISKKMKWVRDQWKSRDETFVDQWDPVEISSNRQCYENPPKKLDILGGPRPPKRSTHFPRVQGRGISSVDSFARRSSTVEPVPVGSVFSYEYQPNTHSIHTQIKFIQKIMKIEKDLDPLQASLRKWHSWLVQPCTSMLFENIWFISNLYEFIWICHVVTLF